MDQSEEGPWEEVITPSPLVRIGRLRQALRDAGLSAHHIQAIEYGREIPDEPLEMTFE